MVNVTYKETERPIESISTRSIFDMDIKIIKQLDGDYQIRVGSSAAVVRASDMKEMAKYLIKMV